MPDEKHTFYAKADFSVVERRIPILSNEAKLWLTINCGNSFFGKLKSNNYNQTTL